MTDASPKPVKNNIIAIASGKGGVGKTWLSITLAHLMARSGRRVLLFDGDIGLANIDVQLGITPDKDINHYMANKATLDDIIMHDEDTGIDLIAGRSGSGALANVSVNRLREFGRDLLRVSKNYETVLLDLGAGVEPHIRFLTSLSSRCLIVLTDEPTSLTDAYAFIKLIRRDYPHVEIHVAINQAGSKKEGEKTFAAIQTACKNFLSFEPKLAGIIRKDNKVKEAIRHQQSLLTRASGTVAATDAAAISVKLMQKQ